MKFSHAYRTKFWYLLGSFRKEEKNRRVPRRFLDERMVWYGMVTLFKHGISFRYTFIEKTNFLTSLKTKIKEIKLIKMKRKHLLFKEAVCKNRISLVKLFIDQNLCLLIFP